MRALRAVFLMYHLVRDACASICYRSMCTLFRLWIIYTLKIVVNTHSVPVLWFWASSFFFLFKTFFSSCVEFQSGTVSAFCFLCMLCCCWHNLLKPVPWSHPPCSLLARIPRFRDLFSQLVPECLLSPFKVWYLLAFWKVPCWSCTSLSCMQKMLLWGDLQL